MSHFLGVDGRAELQKALEDSDDPLKLIEDLQSLEHFDLSEFQVLYSLADFANIDVDSLLSDFVNHQKDVILNRLKTMEVDAVQRLLKDIQPYANLPFFEPIVRAVVGRLKDIPSWFPLPESMKQDLTPADKVRFYKDKPNEFLEFVTDAFDEAMCDFSDADNFSYLRLFNLLSPFCFSELSLYQAVANFCETNFLKSYHAAYCVIRTRLAITDLPFSKVDPLRPLAILVTRAVSNEANFQEIDKAASICPDKAQIILSLPQFTLKYRLKSYLFSFGIKRSDKEIWARHLDSGNDEAVEFMRNTPLFARVIGLSVVQKTKVNPAFVKTLARSPPQCDVAYLMCRMFTHSFEPILQTWAAQNGAIFIDYVTLCKSRGFGTPNLDPPELTSRQKLLYDNIRIL